MDQLPVVFGPPPADRECLTVDGDDAEEEPGEEKQDK